MDKRLVKHLSVPGDGNCLFNSIVNSLHIQKVKKKYNNKYYSYPLPKDEFYKKAMNLRKRTIRWLRNNLDFLVGTTGRTIAQEINEDLDWSDSQDDVNGYLERMNQSGEYGGQIEMTALSNLLKKNIKTYIDKGGLYSPIGLGYKINDKEKDNILIYHNFKKSKSNTLHHFETLILKENTEVISKQRYDNLFKRTRKNDKTKRKKKLRRTRKR